MAIWTSERVEQVLDSIVEKIFDGDLPREINPADLITQKGDLEKFFHVAFKRTRSKWAQEMFPSTELEEGKKDYGFESFVQEIDRRLQEFEISVENNRQASNFLLKDERDFVLEYVSSYKQGEITLEEALNDLEIEGISLTNNQTKKYFRKESEERLENQIENNLLESDLTDQLLKKNGKEGKIIKSKDRILNIKKKLGLNGENHHFEKGNLFEALVGIYLVDKYNLDKVDFQVGMNVKYKDHLGVPHRRVYLDYLVQENEANYELEVSDRPTDTIIEVKWKNLTEGIIDSVIPQIVAYQNLNGHLPKMQVLCREKCTELEHLVGQDVDLKKEIKRLDLELQKTNSQSIFEYVLFEDVIKGDSLFEKALQVVDKVVEEGDVEKIKNHTKAFTRIYQNGNDVRYGLEYALEFIKEGEFLTVNDFGKKNKESKDQLREKVIEKKTRERRNSELVKIYNHYFGKDVKLYNSKVENAIREMSDETIEDILNELYDGKSRNGGRCITSIERKEDLISWVQDYKKAYFRKFEERIDRIREIRKETSDKLLSYNPIIEKDFKFNQKFEQQFNDDFVFYYRKALESVGFSFQGSDSEFKEHVKRYLNDYNQKIRQKNYEIFEFIRSPVCELADNREELIRDKVNEKYREIQEIIDEGSDNELIVFSKKAKQQIGKNRRKRKSKKYSAVDLMLKASLEVFPSEAEVVYRKYLNLIEASVKIKETNSDIDIFNCDFRDNYLKEVVNSFDRFGVNSIYLPNTINLWSSRDLGFDKFEESIEKIVEEESEIAKSLQHTSIQENLKDHFTVVFDENENLRDVFEWYNEDNDEKNIDVLINNFKSEKGNNNFFNQIYQLNLNLLEMSINLYSKLEKEGRLEQFTDELVERGWLNGRIAISYAFLRQYRFKILSELNHEKAREYFLLEGPTTEDLNLPFGQFYEKITQISNQDVELDNRLLEEIKENWEREKKRKEIDENKSLETDQELYGESYSEEELEKISEWVKQHKKAYLRKSEEELKTLAEKIQPSLTEFEEIDRLTEEVDNFAKSFEKDFNNEISFYHRKALEEITIKFDGTDEEYSSKLGEIFTTYQEEINSHFEQILDYIQEEIINSAKTESNQEEEDIKYDKLLEIVEENYIKVQEVIKKYEESELVTNSKRALQVIGKKRRKRKSKKYKNTELVLKNMFEIIPKSTKIVHQTYLNIIETSRGISKLHPTFSPLNKPLDKEQYLAKARLELNLLLATSAYTRETINYWADRHKILPDPYQYLSRDRDVGRMFAHVSMDLNNPEHYLDLIDDTKVNLMEDSTIREIVENEDDKNNIKSAINQYTSKIKESLLNLNKKIIEMDGTTYYDLSQRNLTHQFEERFIEKGGLNARLGLGYLFHRLYRFDALSKLDLDSAIEYSQRKEGALILEDLRMPYLEFSKHINKLKGEDDDFFLAAIIKHSTDKYEDNSIEELIKEKRRGELELN